MSDIFDCDEINTIIKNIELFDLFYKLNIEDRNEFIFYIRNEYFAIDDEYSNIIEKIIFYMENCVNGKELEMHINYLYEENDSTKINLILNSILEYLKDVVESVF